MVGANCSVCAQLCNFHRSLPFRRRNLSAVRREQIPSPSISSNLLALADISGGFGQQVRATLSPQSISYVYFLELPRVAL